MALHRGRRAQFGAIETKPKLQIAPLIVAATAFIFGGVALMAGRR